MGVSVLAFRVETFRQKTFELFCKNFTGDTIPEPTLFSSFLCPVAMAEALVDEYIYEDYGVLELLVLRLYDLGIRDAHELADLSGMPLNMIEKVLLNEELVYHHIDSHQVNPITEMGRKTLEENRPGTGTEKENHGPRSHSMYATVRKMHIEAATGTVIPGYMECELKHMRAVMPDNVDGVAPRESVAMDEELRTEINNRLQEYKHMDILNEGDTIRGIKELRSTRILYRWACLARFEGMRYPMIVMQGRSSVDKLGMDSLRGRRYGEPVAIPLSVAEADRSWLEDHGFRMDNILVRSSEKFEYLENMTQSFGIQAAAELVEDAPAVYEDEMETTVDDTPDNEQESAVVEDAQGGERESDIAEEEPQG